MYKVLIVDDKALIRRGLISSIGWKELQMEPAGEAENGEKALSIIEKERPDIVITDIRMPDMDGIELLKQIHVRHSRIVTIVISGYDDFHYAQMAIKFGSIDYIMKPIDPSELNASLQKACSILDQNKLPAPSTGQMLRELFQKSIKEIQYDGQEYRALYEEFGLEGCLYCAAVIKYKKCRAVQGADGLDRDGMDGCLVETGDGIMTFVFFAARKDMPIHSFEFSVLKAVKSILSGSRCEGATAGIGKVAECLVDLSHSYRTACEAALYGALLKDRELVEYSRIENRKPMHFSLDDYERELVVHVTSGNVKHSKQILEQLFAGALGNPDISMESARQLFHKLCFILIKLNVSFENEIYDWLDKIRMPEYWLRYDSMQEAAEIVYHFYGCAAQKYVDEAGGKNSMVAKVKSFIENNYSEDISLKRLSDLFHINASYLTRIFKQEQSDSIQAYIMKVRIEHAKRILASGRVNIQKLAEAVGYDDSTYFFKVFKKVTGMTPREYLRQSGKKEARRTMP